MNQLEIKISNKNDPNIPLVTGEMFERLFISFLQKIINFDDFPLKKLIFFFISQSYFLEQVVHSEVPTANSFPVDIR